jgi:hypothetical protein
MVRGTSLAKTRDVNQTDSQTFPQGIKFTRSESSRNCNVLKIFPNTSAIIIIFLSSNGHQDSFDSATVMVDPHHTETSSLQFIKWTELYKTEKPYQIFIDLPLTAPRTNVKFEVKDVLFRDIRGSETDLDIDKHGFIMRTTKNFEDVDENPCAHRIEKVYLPEVEELLKREVKEVDRVKIFDWRVTFGLSHMFNSTHFPSRMSPWVISMRRR